MEVEGGCYCRAVRYKAEGDPLMSLQCHCRECQYVSGGSPNVIMGMPEAGFVYTSGEPAKYTRSDLENPVTREFCSQCGTHLTSRVPGMPLALIKVGTLDDVSAYSGPQMAIFTCDQQSFHQIPEGIPTFEKMPG